jgi:hypothetical protein
MNAEAMEQSRKKMARVIAKAWSDESFKKKLLADPKAVLASEGIPLPAEVTVKALEQTDKVMYFVIPSKPSSVQDSVFLEQRVAANPANLFLGLDVFGNGGNGGTGSGGNGGAGGNGGNGGNGGDGGDDLGF